uniref:Transmembrane protein n=1 Tax=Steinernema glaseri TaxID=37863 RepID=A0A1I8AF10_9BILA
MAGDRCPGKTRLISPLASFLMVVHFSAYFYTFIVGVVYSCVVLIAIVMYAIMNRSDFAWSLRKKNPLVDNKKTKGKKGATTVDDMKTKEAKTVDDKKSKGKKGATTVDDEKTKEKKGATTVDDEKTKEKKPSGDKKKAKGKKHK